MVGVCVDLRCGSCDYNPNGQLPGDKGSDDESCEEFEIGMILRPVRSLRPYRSTLLRKWENGQAKLQLKAAEFMTVGKIETAAYLRAAYFCVQNRKNESKQSIMGERRLYAGWPKHA